MAKKIRLEEDDREPDKSDLDTIDEIVEDVDDDDLEDEDDDDDEGEEIAFARVGPGATLRSRQDLPRSGYEVR